MFATLERHPVCRSFYLKTIYRQHVQGRKARWRQACYHARACLLYVSAFHRCRSCVPDGMICQLSGKIEEQRQQNELSSPYSASSPEPCATPDWLAEKVRVSMLQLRWGHIDDVLLNNQIEKEADAISTSASSKKSRAKKARRLVATFGSILRSKTQMH